jgi:Protein of unknown function (DUF1376)
MPYDVVAFETDEAAKLWTLEEEGAFHRLIRHQWTNGSVPNDIARLAPICRCLVEQMTKLWEVLKNSFPVCQDDPGRCKNPKTEKERLWVEARAHRRSRAGQAGNEARWGPAKSEPAESKQVNRNAIAPHPIPSHPIPEGMSQDKCSTWNTSQRKSYGSTGSVLLNDTEYAKLLGQFQERLPELIERLDRYRHIRPKQFSQYKDHFRVLLNWGEDDQAKTRQPRRPTPHENVAATNRATGEKIKKRLSKSTAPTPAQLRIVKKDEGDE